MKPLVYDQWRGTNQIGRAVTKTIPAETKMIIVMPLITDWNYIKIDDSVVTAISGMFENGYGNILQKVGDSATWDKAYYSLTNTTAAYSNATYSATWTSATSLYLSCPDGGITYICIG